MDLGLAGRVAVVTGGASNIGRAISLTLAQEGAHVAIWDRDVPAAEKVAAIIAESGGRALAIPTDVTDNETVLSAAEKTRELGTIWYLVNCAGGPSPYKRFMEKPEADILRDITLNLVGTMNSTRAVVPHMPESGGSIVNIASESARRGSKEVASYAASKGGVISLTRVLAAEFAPRIRVNSVCPMFSIPHSEEEFGEDSRWGVAGKGFSDLHEQRRQQIVAGIPLGREGTGQDIANTVAFLLGEPASYVTGQCWGVNGGGYMA